MLVMDNIGINVNDIVEQNDGVMLYVGTQLFQSLYGWRYDLEFVM